MKQISKKIILTLVVMGLTNNSYAIDLNPRIKNTDKQTFNTNSGTKIKEGLFQISSEFNYLSKPMVVRNKTTGEVVPLVDNLMNIDFGINYALTNSFQIGALIPVEKVSALEDQTYMNGVYLEAKYKLFKNYAIVPFYEMASKNTIKTKMGNKIIEVPMGSKNGNYGFKLVSEWTKDNEYSLAAQIGYKINPENEYLTIDQTSSIIIGSALSIPLSENISTGVEINGQKMTNEFPIEAIGFINMKTDIINVQFGAGSGNLQGSGSNDLKAFVGLSMNFGESKKGMTIPSVNKRSYDNIPEAPKKSDEKIMEDGIEHQQGPEEEVNQSSFVVKTYGRHIASEGIDAEIMNALIDSEEADKVKEEDPLGDMVEPRVKKPLKKKENKDSLVKLVAPPKDKTSKKDEGRMEVLANGQKVKVFKKQVTELPKEVNVVYMTEQEFSKKQKELMASKKQEKTGAEALFASSKKVLEKVKNEVVVKQEDLKVEHKAKDLEPLKKEEKKQEVIVEQKFEDHLKIAEATFKNEKPKTEKKVKNKEVKKIAKKKEVQEVKIDIVAKEKDPEPIVLENPMAIVEQQGTEVPIVPVDITKLNKQETNKEETKVVIVESNKEEVKAEPSKEIESVNSVIVENNNVEILKEEPLKEKIEEVKISLEEKEEPKIIKNENVVIANENKPVEVVSELKPDAVEIEVSPVTITVESRELLKKQLQSEFSSLSLDEKRKQMSNKVIEEQNKLTEQIAKKQKEDEELKKKLEEEELAKKIAEEAKRVRENEPLAESVNAEPMKAATEEELKSVQISNKRNARPIIIALPQAQLNAYIDGRKIPTLSKESNPNAIKQMNLLEENDSLEEAQGPSYGLDSAE